MKKQIATLALVTALTSGASAALAQPLMMPSVPAVPVTTHVAPVVVTKPVGPSFQTKMLNTYRGVRAFWLSRAIVR